MSFLNSKAIGNATWIIVCKIIKALLTFFVTSLTARMLGPAEYGLINYAAGLVSFFIPLMKLGFDGILVYEYVNNKESSGVITGTSIVLNFISSLLCILGISIISVILDHNDPLAITICIVYSIVLIFQSIELIYYWFQANLLAKIPAIATVFSYLIVAVTQFLILYFKLPLWIFALSNSLEYACMSIVLYIYYINYSKYKLSFSITMAKRLLSRGKYYIIAGLMTTIYNQTDRIMLKQLIDDSAVGVYSAAAVCSSMFSFVFIAIIDSFRPILLDGSDKKYDFNKKIQMLYTFIVYSSLFVSLGVFVLSPFIINIMYGPNYSNSVPILKILIWFTVFSYLGTIRDIWLLYYNKQKYIFFINMIGALTNVILNFLFIDKFGVAGAAYASLCTQFITNFILSFLLKPIRNNFFVMIKSLNFISFFKNIKNRKDT